MPLLSTADKVYLGTQSADAVYLGTAKLWPAPPAGGAWGPDEGVYLSSAVPAAGGSYDGTFSVGNRIQIMADGRITGIRYWRGAGTPATRSVDLWTDAGALLAHGMATGIVGWNTFAIPPITVALGDIVRVAHGYSGAGAGDTWPYTNAAHVSASPRLQWLLGVFSPPLSSGGQDDFPGSTTDIYNYFADVVYQEKLAGVPSFSPDDITGLAIWLDASQTATVNPWPNLGSGADPTLVGSPAPALMPGGLNGLPVIRLTNGAGRYRFSGTGITRDYTLAYVGRIWGPTRQRVINATYPEGGNLLYGFWNGFQDVAYAGGFMVPNTQVSATTDWKLYSADATPSLARLFSDGVFLGAYPPTEGFGGTFNISGYEAAGPAETTDCEIAEVLFYDHKLTDAEREQVEGYLRTKWFVPPVSTMDPDTAAYLAATGLDPSYTPALDGLVVGLKNAGLWTKMRAIYPFIGGTAALHKWNLKDPRDLDAAYRLTFNGGTHSTALGYKPNAAPDSTTFCGDSHLTPAGLLDINSTHMSLYSLSAMGNAPRCDAGHYNWDGGGGRFHVITHYTGGEFYYSMGTTAVPNGSGGDGSGLYIATRTGQTAQAGYRNGVLVGSDASGVYALPTTSVFIGGLNGYPREYSDMPMGFASIGDGLTAQNAADLYTVVQAYQTALGRQVA